VDYLGGEKIVLKGTTEKPDGAKRERRKTTGPGNLWERELGCSVTLVEPNCRCNRAISDRCKEPGSGKGKGKKKDERVGKISNTGTRIKRDYIKLRAVKYERVFMLDDRKEWRGVRKGSCEGYCEYPSDSKMSRPKVRRHQRLPRNHLLCLKREEEVAITARGKAVMQKGSKRDKISR